MFQKIIRSASISITLFILPLIGLTISGCGSDIPWDVVADIATQVLQNELGDQETTNGLSNSSNTASSGGSSSTSSSSSSSGSSSSASSGSSGGSSSNSSGTLTVKVYNNTGDTIRILNGDLGTANIFVVVSDGGWVWQSGTHHTPIHGYEYRSNTELNDSPQYIVRDGQTIVFGPPLPQG